VKQIEYFTEIRESWSGYITYKMTTNGEHLFSQELRHGSGRKRFDNPHIAALAGVPDSGCNSAPW